MVVGIREKLTNIYETSRSMGGDPASPIVVIRVATCLLMPVICFFSYCCRVLILSIFVVRLLSLTRSLLLSPTPSLSSVLIGNEPLWVLQRATPRSLLEEMKGKKTEAERRWEMEGLWSALVGLLQLCPP